jgi:gag-polyprotein putative aspartyl protease
MIHIARFPYEQTPVGIPMPYIPIQLEAASRAVRVKALVDTGAMVNVIPKAVGEALNLKWDDGEPVQLGGNLGKASARTFTLNCTVTGLEATPLEVNWSMLEDVPVILGQIDFFAQFDVCFSYAENEISIRTRKGSS